MKTLGIDASNIKTGGGFTHLKELLTFAEPKRFGFNKVIVYGGAHIKKLPQRDWLDLKVIPSLEKASLLKEMLWRIQELPDLAKSECDLLFAPGGIFFSKKIKYVSMSQNMLIWENKERDRLDPLIRIKLRLIQFFQKRSFKHATGIIYISNYAKNFIQQSYPTIKNKPSVKIYHGVSNRFRKRPTQIDLQEKNKISILYISHLNHYKFQWNVVDAVKKVRIDYNLNLHLDLVGGAKPAVLQKMKKQLKVSDDFVTYHGVVPYNTIEKFYHGADLFVFASTCENMPNILIEAMSSGLPLACSNYGPMPEILRDGGVYFDPEVIDEIANSIATLINNPTKTKTLADKAFNYSNEYEWRESADKTFKFFQECLT